MSEKQFRVSGAWIGRRVEVEFIEYGPGSQGKTIYVSLPGKLLNVQDEGIVFAKEFDSGSPDKRTGPPRFYPWHSMSDVRLLEEQEG